ncbi:hypothetical protein [Streptosporangium sp. NBC_01469]|uniref:hypothetical protein n=1 Tax=Streptosporangium sp. NBC_01469 TaxID=2903898 RepID=UPI002E2C8186|nr:hypothetical protein [Streptosporangium sp. NBC_01469]
MSPGTGPTSPDFTGIDPDLMRSFVTALERGRDVIGEQSERIRQLLAAAEVPAAGLGPIREIDGWVGDELPKLRERLETINQDLPMMGDAPHIPKQGSMWTGDPLQDPFQWGLLPYDEKTGKSPAGNAKKGTDLAAEFRRLPELSPGRSNAAYDRILDKLADGQKDAYLTAGFFRSLGPQGMISMISRLERYDKKASDKHRQVMGDALATAVGAQPALLGSAWQAGNLKKAPDHELTSLLRHGMFPTAWLTEIARSRVGKPVGDGDGSRPRRWETELAPLLPALANNPDVARGLFNAMSREDLRDLFTELNRLGTLKTYVFPVWGTELPKPSWRGPKSMDFETGAEFGRMLAAAGGAYEKGPHSPEAAKFAFNVMTIMGDLKDADGTSDTPATPMEVAPKARIFMSTLAGAYAAEITEGANIGDANMIEESTLKPFTSAFGMTSAFTLSPKDTYRFLKTFADSPANLAPFDRAMGGLSQKLIADASEKARRTGDVDHLDRVFTALGNVRGFELGAVEKVQGNLDAIDKQQKDTFNFFRDATIGLVSIYASPVKAADFAWYALSTSFSGYGAFIEEDKTRMDQVTKNERTATLGRQHTYAHILMANGFDLKVTPAEFQATCPPGVAIADAKGNLKPFSELIKQGNEGLEAFERWAVLNGMGSREKLSIGKLSDDTANWFEGGNKRGRERSLAFDS